LAVEVKNFASFNATAVLLHDIMVTENDVLEAGSAGDVFPRLT